MEDQKKSKLTQWLELLQQESWQLELIISGFAIFLLVGVYEPMQGLWHDVKELTIDSGQWAALMVPVIILQGSWVVLIINLIVHVLLRGLWISTVGLRYVSEDIDFEVLRLHPLFDRFLKKRIVSFDHYIERLEKICSIIFAFSFLIIFVLIALGLWVAFIGLFNILIELLPAGKFREVLDDILSIALLLSSLLYFLDFISFGWIKRRKWLARFYYPVYRFYSLITFAPLYRPIYYNLADNRFGRWVGFLLVPYIIFIMAVSSLTYVNDTYFPVNPGKTALSKSYYDDLRNERSTSRRASIPSKYVDNGFIELFLPYNANINDKVIEALCPDLEPARFTGVKLDGVIKINGGGSRNKKSKNDSLLICMSQMHRVFVDDSLYSDIRYRFYEHPQRKRPGLLTILNVQDLEKGEHLLKVETYSLVKDSLSYRESAWIPFWKE